MSDDGDGQFNLLFARITDLAFALGDVTEDGSGLDGIWTAEVDDIDTDQTWGLAVNADGEKQTARVPGSEHDTITVKPYNAAIFYGERLPIGFVHPYAGSLAVSGAEFERTTEDQLIASIEQRLLDLEFDGIDDEHDFEPTILDVDEATEGGEE